MADLSKTVSACPVIARGASAPWQSSNKDFLDPHAAKSAARDGEPSEQLRKILCGSVASFVAIIVLMAATLVRSAVAVRYLSTEMAGFWFLFLTIITLTAIGDFGLSPSLSREVGLAAKKTANSLRISNLFCTIKTIVNYVSLIVMMILCGCGYFYLRHLGVAASNFNHIFYAFVICSISIIVQFQANPYLAVIYGLGNVAAERGIRALSSILGVATSLLLVQYGLYGLSMGYLVQTLVSYGLSRYLLQQKITTLSRGKYLTVVLKRIWSPSWQWAIMNIGIMLIFQVSSFVITHVMGIGQVTQFAILLQIFSLILALAGMVSYVIVPLVTQAHSFNDHQKIRHYFFLSVRSSVAVAMISATGLYFFIDDVVRVWLGNNFVINKTALVILLIAAILEANRAACALIVMATGYVKFATITIITGLLNLALSLLLVPNYGITGAAIAIFLAQILANNWYAVWLAVKKLTIPMGYYCNTLCYLGLFLVYIVIINLGISWFTVNIENSYIKLSVISGYEILFLLPIIVLCCRGWQGINSAAIDVSQQV